MLNTMKLTGNEKKIANYHTSLENYYYLQDISKRTPHRETEAYSHVRVYGELCPSLHLEEGQRITKETLQNLLSCKDHNGKKIARQHKIHGYDFTFAAPKTLSIAALATVKDIDLTTAHDLAVLETMKEIEKRFAYHRSGSRAAKKSKGFVYVTAKDGFNRENEPHLHTHVVLMNLTKVDNQYLALDGTKILTRTFNKLFGSIYRSKLASKINKLGYGVSYTKEGRFRLDCVSHELEDAFSTRRKQILEEKNKVGSDMKAFRNTRKEKDKLTSKQEQLDLWNERIKQFKKSSESENRKEAVRQRKELSTKARFSVEANQEKEYDRTRTTELEKWQLALRRATEFTATPTRQEIIKEYSYEVLRTEKFEGISYDELIEGFEKQVKFGNIVKVTKRKGQSAEKYTSWDMINAEKGYMEIVGKKSKEFIFTKEKADRELTRYQVNQKKNNLKTLSDKQYKAVYKILTSDNKLDVLQGDAGAGKTTAMRAVVEIFNREGYKVQGLANSGSAARELEKGSGAKATTVASYLGRKDKDERKSQLIIIDEGSMIGSRDAAKLFKAADKKNDKILIVGDRNQLVSISAGNVFGTLVKEYKKDGKLITLNENFRQEDPIYREAVDNARVGKMKESLDLLDKDKGAMTETLNAHKRRADLAKEYRQFFEEGTDTLVISGTRAGSEELNIRIRTELIESGLIDQSSEKEYIVSRNNTDGIRETFKLRLTVGDKIIFTDNEYIKYDVRNGEKGTILETNENSLKIKCDGKQERILEVDLNEYNNFAYGYAQTTFKSQGQTYDNVIIEAETRVPSLVDMRNQYVNITRAKEYIHIYTSDKEELKERSQYNTRVFDTNGIEVSYEELKAARKKLREGRNVKELQKKEEVPDIPKIDVKEEHDFMKEYFADPDKESNDKTRNRYAEEEKKKRKRETGQSLYNNTKFSMEEKKKIGSFLKSEESADIWKYQSIEPETRIQVAKARLEGDASALDGVPEKDHKIAKKLLSGKGKDKGRSR